MSTTDADWTWPGGLLLHWKANQYLELKIENKMKIMKVRTQVRMLTLKVLTAKDISL